ncbi:hypothetical protein KUH32_13275 [Thalassococcus sp. CAU 1522]|uniref:Uncharacterized protein n=1 Tax=Thalassococcus arenae TaxID=2851652 RepID=A0ABS6N9U9_9RHOB|nr:hypothetical protein [Thalassococcus arenae]MBV2360753.1 hypothetical protein [Thalassococcus arenae]
MNANQIINMVVRLVMRKLISKGVDAGMNRAFRGGGGQQSAPDTDGLTPQERRQMRQNNKQMRQAKQAAKVAGRMNRF